MRCFGSAFFIVPICFVAATQKGKQMKKGIVGIIAVLLMCCNLISCGSAEEKYSGDIFETSDGKQLGEATSENATNKKTLDVFAGVELGYWGVNGCGEAYFKRDIEFTVDDFYFKKLTEDQKKFSDFHELNSLNVIYNNKRICRIEYKVISAKNLKKGDTVTVYATIKNEPSAFDTLDYEPVLSKTYTVPDLGEFLDKEEDFTKDLIEDIDILVGEDGETIEKVYYIKAKPGVEVPGDATSFIAVVTKTSEGSFSAGKVYDIYYELDGTLTCRFWRLKKWAGFEEAVAALEADIADEYTYKVIN